MNKAIKTYIIFIVIILLCGCSEQMNNEYSQQSNNDIKLPVISPDIVKIQNGANNNEDYNKKIVDMEVEEILSMVNRKLTIEDFKEVKLGMSNGEVWSILGPPTREIGSGITVYHYVVDDVGIVVLNFGIKNKLLGMALFTENGIEEIPDQLLVYQLKVIDITYKIK